MSAKAPGLCGLLALGLLLVVNPSGAQAQQQSDAQQKCLRKLNADGKAVAHVQGASNFSCLKKAGAGTLGGSAQSCLTADANGKVQKKKTTTVTDETNFSRTPP